MVDKCWTQQRLMRYVCSTAAVFFFFLNVLASIAEILVEQNLEKTPAKLILDVGSTGKE